MSDRRKIEELEYAIRELSLELYWAKKGIVEAEMQINLLKNYLGVREETTPKTTKLVKIKK